MMDFILIIFGSIAHLLISLSIGAIAGRLAIRTIYGRGQ